MCRSKIAGPEGMHNFYLDNVQIPPSKIILTYTSIYSVEQYLIPYTQFIFLFLWFACSYALSIFILSSMHFFPYRFVASLYIIYLFIFNWSIVDLQCYVTFRCTAQWFSFTYIYIYIYKIYIYIIYIYIQILFPYKLLQNIEHSSLCYTVGPCWLSILYTVE